ncbi:MAG: ParB/RepB/Spo0J family partition protein [Bacilli bacterium]
METSKRRALGRGLEELFNNEPMDYNKIEEQILNSTPKDQVIEIKLSELRSNPYQPRKNFDMVALNELASSIKEHGVFQPIIVKKSIKGYEIVAGERRVKASAIAGKTTVPAIVRDFTDEEMMEIALLENLQRENLNPLEEALAYKKLLISLNLTQDELALKVGKSRSHITNMIGLLSLPELVKTMVIENKISMSHARVLSKIEDKEKILTLANKVLIENLNVRQLEQLSLNEEYKKKKQNVRRHNSNEEYKYVEELLCDKFGAKVKISNQKIEIYFANNNDLNRLLEIMKINN